MQIRSFLAIFVTSVILVVVFGAYRLPIAQAQISNAQTSPGGRPVLPANPVPTPGQVLSAPKTDDTIAPSTELTDPEIQT